MDYHTTYAEMTILPLLKLYSYKSTYRYLGLKKVGSTTKKRANYFFYNPSPLNPKNLTKIQPILHITNPCEE